MKLTTIPIKKQLLNMVILQCTMCIEFLRKSSAAKSLLSSQPPLFGGHLRESLIPEGNILVEV